VACGGIARLLQPGPPASSRLFLLSCRSPSSCVTSNVLDTFRPMPRDHTGWRSRGYLPHYDGAGETQHIIFRLADSLPKQALAAVEHAPREERLDHAETSLDRGFGSRALARPDIASVVANALQRFDGRRYRLLAWCVMPTHVHVLSQQAEGWPLAGIVHSWKSFTSLQANRILGRSGPFWARDYFDRAMRSEGQVDRACGYIEANPVIAGLCQDPAEWPWSSASAARSNKSRLEAGGPGGTTQALPTTPSELWALRAR
jgi:putative transposase